MSSAFPELDNMYGFLSGAAFTIPYSILGLFSGMLTRHKSRRKILGLLMMFLSMSHMANGFATSVWMIAALRVLHGAVSSAIDPLSYSLVSDYFSNEIRS